MIRARPTLFPPSPLRRAVLAAGVALLAGCAAVPTVPDAALDAAVRAQLGADFSGVVLLARAGRAPAVRAYGLARQEGPVPARPEMRYQIGSISKWVATVAVLRFVDQGKLALDTPVGAYIPGLPAATATQVTLRHLLSNTSGIPNGVSAAFRADRSVGALQLAPQEAALRFGSGDLLFAPGTRFDYGPTHWVLVAAVLEHAGGAPFADVIRREVLAPAGTGAVVVPMGELDGVADAALAYAAGPAGARKTTPNNRFVVASGTLAATAAELAALAQAVYEGPLLSAPARAELSRVMVAQEEYALGGRVKSWRLGGRMRAVAYESGVSGGFKSLLAHVPGEGRTVVILNNTDLPQDTLARAGQTLLDTLYD